MKETKQKGAALIIFAVIFALAATAFLVSQLDASGVKIERDKKTSLALAEAKVALVGSVVSTNNIAEPAYLPNPDLKLSTAIPEGSESANFGTTDYSIIGKFPWHSLGVSPHRDGWNECLWYVVSGRFKKSPPTDVFNWDTQGQITVIDINGNTLASNLAALIVSPGALLAGQDRQSATETPQCGGNYDARNYLDAYSAANALAGELNYFSSSSNNRVASNVNNKTFVLAKNDFYNDQFAYVTVDEIFRPIIRRSDFSAQITALLNDAYFQNAVITGNKGTDSVDCSLLLSTNRTFCKNWKEMLLLTELPVSLPSRIITIGGLPAGPCTRVLIFGGQKTGAQTRLTAVNKIEPANYVEIPNLVAFNTPDNSFNGVSVFDAANSSADVMRCL